MITYHCDRCQKTVPGKELFELNLNYKSVEKCGVPSYFANIIKDVTWCKDCLAYFQVGVPKDPEKTLPTLEDFLRDMISDEVQNALQYAS